MHFKFLKNRSEDRQLSKSGYAYTSRRLFPFIGWPAISQTTTLKNDLEAAFISAIIALPQAIAFAILTGMPVHYGIYTAIFPAAIAMFWGSSWHVLSGPNTAMCLLMATVVAPHAQSGSQTYIELILLLTLLVGLIQLISGILHIDKLLSYISDTTIIALTLAVALNLLMSGLGNLLHIQATSELSFFARFFEVFNNIPLAHVPTLITGLVTILAGLIAQLLVPRYALIVAMIFGGATFIGLTSFSPGWYTGVETIGLIQLNESPLALPTFDGQHISTLSSITGDIISIALLGLMQTTIISRSLAKKSRQSVNPRQDILGQGIANLIAPFLSSFAGAGSFNRSAAHFQAGARTPYSALISFCFIWVLVIIGSGVLSNIPSVSVAAMLILVSLNMIDSEKIVQTFRLPGEAIIFLVTLLSSLIFGLSEGVLAGVMASLAIYLNATSKPNVSISEFRSKDGKVVISTIINGNLFFGSTGNIKNQLPQPSSPDANNRILLLKTDHITYLDNPGAELLLALIENWRKSGAEAYLFVARPELLKTLKNADTNNVITSQTIIEPQKPHALKSVLQPLEREDRTLAWQISSDTKKSGSHTRLRYIAQWLRTQAIFGPISTGSILKLLENQSLKFANPGEILIEADASLEDHLIILEGSVEQERSWTEASGKKHSHTIRSDASNTKYGPILISAASRHIRIKAITALQYMTIQANEAEKLMRYRQAFLQIPRDQEAATRQISIIKQLGVLKALPESISNETFRRMESVTVKSNEIIFTQGDPANYFYLVEQGEAEVVIYDPLDGEKTAIDHLQEGDSFGEEALLEKCSRNSTVRMLTPGNLLKLSAADFYELVKPMLASEMTAHDARQRLQQPDCKLLDCRNEIEFSGSRLPDAELIPLHLVPKKAHLLNPEIEYIIYCRSGRRSITAAFLLSERNIKAHSLIGGLSNWPFEIDYSPVQQ